MDPFQIQFSEEAAKSFRQIELYDRLPLVDLFDDMSAGNIPAEDFGEITDEGFVVSVVIVGKFAISYAVNPESRIIRVAEIASADR